MPELPEVQAHAERLTSAFAGAELAAFTPLSFTALKTALPRPDDAVGHALGRVDRRGKFLLLRFDGAPTFVVHLMQGGRLVPDDKQSRRPRNGLARWTFADGRALLLTEAGTERKAGVWVLDGDPLTQPPLDELGVDAHEATLEQLTEALAAKNQRLHGFLRDQHGVAGLGRMLANEICHAAKLSPFAMTAKLTDDEVRRLHEAMRATIASALEHERTLDAMSKSADRPGSVHRRAGDPCPVCGDVIRAVEYSAYEVDYCPTCQTDGKVLADNTTSKFLK
ncbi:MAG TPA: DNA-formamidopyrimidine glycosylase family protein [Microthrixaceae bacterium]|nr:DNA-formamidopyrimidine glycosylase family protein [Microthrixaceae bacterium]